MIEKHYIAIAVLMLLVGIIIVSTPIDAYSFVKIIALLVISALSAGALYNLWRIHVALRYDNRYSWGQRFSALYIGVLLGVAMPVIVGYFFLPEELYEPLEGSSRSPRSFDALWILIALAIIGCLVWDTFFKSEASLSKPENAETGQAISWIENAAPALPQKAKEKYIKISKELIDTYYVERVKPTNDKAVLARRERMQPDIGQAEYTLFEQYETLAKSLPASDEYTPFPLFPISQKLYNALSQFSMRIGEVVPWSFTPQEDQELDRRGLPNEFIKSPFRELGHALPAYQNGEKRFEGTFILAPSGSGKTTALEYLITYDMPYVERSEASIIVMDSQGDFLSRLVSLNQFHPEHGTLKDKLIIIEPSVNYPIPLNPFALGRKYRETENAEEREAITNTVIDMIAHIFSTIGEGGKFTARQELFFKHCVRLTLAVEDGDLNTLYKIFVDKSVEDFARYLPALDESSQQFFDGEFAVHKKVCEELSWRVSAVLANTALARMLNAPTSIDFFEELNEGKFIVVNVKRRQLDEKQITAMGRVIVALVRIAMRRRDNAKVRLPTYFYIDEMHEFLDNDTQLATMIDDVRKYRLALILVTQRLAKIQDPNVKDALLSCGIQLASPNSNDMPTMARALHTEFMEEMPRSHFKLYSRGVTKAMPIQIPHFSLKSLPHMSEEEYYKVRQRNQERYSTTYVQPVTVAEEPEEEITPKKTEY